MCFYSIKDMKLIHSWDIEYVNYFTQPRYAVYYDYVDPTRAYWRSWYDDDFVEYNHYDYFG